MPSQIPPAPSPDTTNFTLKVQDATGSKPLPGLRLRVETLDREGEPGLKLFEGRSDAAGEARLQLHTLEPSAKREASLLERLWNFILKLLSLIFGDLSPSPSLPKLRVIVFGLDGDVLSQQDVQPRADKPLITIQVSDQPLREKVEGRFGDGRTLLGRTFSPALSQFLEDSNIDSLAALRAAKGLEPPPSLSDGDLKDFEEMKAHARLQLISRDHQTNRILIEKDYRDVLSIAEKSLGTFVRSLGKDLPETQAALIHAGATRATAQLNNRYVEQLVVRSDGRLINRKGWPALPPANNEPAPCPCECKHALSPLAYLADLMAYTVQHVKQGGDEIDAGKLSTLFRQPFGSLPRDCSASETLLHQPRICIEVLRRKAVADGPDITARIGTHITRAYRALLNQLVTSYDELRLARLAGDGQRESLAARIGVNVSHLEDLLLAEPDEAKLAKVFGFASTDPDAAARAGDCTLFGWRMETLRAQWAAQDDARTLPILDPDQIRAGWIRLDATAALNLSEEFAAELSSVFKVIRATVVNQQMLEAVLSSIQLQEGADVRLHALNLKFNDAVLEAQWALRQEGKPYEPKFLIDANGNPVSRTLNVAELDGLLFTWKALKSGVATDLDKEHLWHLLVGVEKRNYLHVKWRGRERAQGLAVTPDNFMPTPTIAQSLSSETAGPSEAMLEWRVDVAFRRDWLHLLQAREQQVAELRQQLASAVEWAEEAVLPTLRDDLIDAVGMTAAEVSNQLLIHASASGSQKTTRVAQAIETLQLLMWGIRSGQFENQSLSLDAPNFEEEWKWLGSYATWRSAMFVFLYPENVLMPSLYRNGSWTFNTAKKLISGEFTPSPSDDEWAVGYANWGLGVLSPTSPEGIRRILFFMLLVRTNDGTATELQYEEDLNPYFRWAEWGETIWDDPRAPWPYQFVYLKSPDDVLVCPGHFNAEGGPRAFNWANSDYEIEDTYLLPLHAALTLQQRGEFEAALDFYRWVYDFTRGEFRAPRVKELLDARQGEVQRYDEWLVDPLDPHAVAKTRAGADERFILISVIRCHLDYAESEFAKDTPESRAKARELYATAARLLNSEALGTPDEYCDSRLRRLVIEVGETEYRQMVVAVLKGLRVGSGFVLKEDVWKELAEDLKDVLPSPPPDPPRLEAEVREDVKAVFEKYLSQPTPAPTINEVLKHSSMELRVAMETMLGDPRLFFQIQQSSQPASAMLMSQTLSTVAVVPPGTIVIKAPSFSFCIPPNPLLFVLRLRTEVGLFKLDHCMNVAGMTRPTEPYGAPTDARSGMPTILPDGRISAPAARALPPTQYRYKILVERAKLLVSIAQQLEASYLSALERKDQEDYNILLAHQQLGVARATVDLQTLRVTEATHGQDLADLQQDRADEMFTHYDDLIKAGWSEGETWAVNLSRLNTGIQLTVAALTAGVAALAGGVSLGIITAGSGPGAFVSGLAGAAGTTALAMSASQTAYSSVTGGLSSWVSTLSMITNFERREEEWKFQKALAEIDQQLATAQKTLADDRHDIAVKEKSIAAMQSENAGDVVNFLNNKFTNPELYAWMSGVVGSAYRYFLQEATSVGKLAQRQLAFERQEPSLGFVLDDYWTYTDSQSLLPGDDSSPDRKGLTGSARLLQDLYKLDQQAFLTDQRKLQLSRTLSLALLDPLAFAQFRESGRLPFSTTVEMFDRNFPGHYLRLIKRVRVSVVALIPPTEGIKATLTLQGPSRVITADPSGAAFNETVINRLIESVALSSPLNATGVFELVEQPEMLLPFEGSGVAAGWLFEMPKAANPFDYDTLADVLVTVEYTALHSDILRRRVIQEMDSRVSAERVFSLRRQFPDQWYALHHPSSGPRKINLKIGRSDFPPNIANDLHIQHLTIFFARQDGVTLEGSLDEIKLTPKAQNGAAATSVSAGALVKTKNGVVSTRQPAGAPLQPFVSGAWTPIGEWELSFAADQDTSDLFKEDESGLDDILMVITWQSTALPWPAA
ncbi:MAG TPA: neuraminidase-like domain-containing protein [Pyrinomonadaceae bacterium]